MKGLNRRDLLVSVSAAVLGHGCSKQGFSQTLGPKKWPINLSRKAGGPEDNILTVINKDGSITEFGWEYLENPRKSVISTIKNAVTVTDGGTSLSQMSRIALLSDGSVATWYDWNKPPQIYNAASVSNALSGKQFVQHSLGGTLASDGTVSISFLQRLADPTVKPNLVKTSNGDVVRDVVRLKAATLFRKDGQAFRAANGTAIPVTHAERVIDAALPSIDPMRRSPEQLGRYFLTERGSLLVDVNRNSDSRPMPDNTFKKIAGPTDGRRIDTLGEYLLVLTRSNEVWSVGVSEQTRKQGSAKIEGLDRVVDFQCAANFVVALRADGAVIVSDIGKLVIFAQNVAVPA